MFLNVLDLIDEWALTCQILGTLLHIDYEIHINDDKEGKSQCPAKQGQCWHCVGDVLLPDIHVVAIKSSELFLLWNCNILIHYLSAGVKNVQVMRR